MKITKIDGNGKEYNYGHYERRDTKTIYIVEED